MMWHEESIWCTPDKCAVCVIVWWSAVLNKESILLQDSCITTMCVWGLRGWSDAGPSAHTVCSSRGRILTLFERILFCLRIFLFGISKWYSSIVTFFSCGGLGLWAPVLIVEGFRRVDGSAISSTHIQAFFVWELHGRLMHPENRKNERDRERERDLNGQRRAFHCKYLVGRSHTNHPIPLYLSLSLSVTLFFLSSPSLHGQREKIWTNCHSVIYLCHMTFFLERTVLKAIYLLPICQSKRTDVTGFSSRTTEVILR